MHVVKDKAHPIARIESKGAATCRDRHPVTRPATPELPRSSASPWLATTVYKHVLDWAARLRNANVPDEWRALSLAASRLLDDFLREAEEFGPRTQAAIEKILLAGVDGPQTLKLKFEYHVPESQEIKTN